MGGPNHGESGLILSKCGINRVAETKLCFLAMVMDRYDVEKEAGL